MYDEDDTIGIEPNSGRGALDLTILHPQIRCIKASALNRKYFPVWLGLSLGNVVVHAGRSLRPTPRH
jgi:hypothetical protein